MPAIHIAVSLVVDRAGVIQVLLQSVGLKLMVGWQSDQADQNTALVIIL